MGMIMADFTPKELGEAHRAILSLRNKSEKAFGKLKEGSWQKTLLDSYVKAADTALKLIDGDMAMLLSKRRTEKYAYFIYFSFIFHILHINFSFIVKARR